MSGDISGCHTGAEKPLVLVSSGGVGQGHCQTAYNAGRARALSHFSPVRLCATLCTVACQASLSMGILQARYWNALPCPPPGDLPNPGTDPTSLTSPALTGRFFTTRATWEAQCIGQSSTYAHNY